MGAYSAQGCGLHSSLPRQHTERMVYLETDAGDVRRKVRSPSNSSQLSFSNQCSVIYFYYFFKKLIFFLSFLWKALGIFELLVGVLLTLGYAGFELAIFLPQPP